MSEVLQKRISRRTAMSGAGKLVAGLLLGGACGTDKDNGTNTIPKAALQTGTPEPTATPDLRTATVQVTATGTKTETPSPAAATEEKISTPDSEAPQTGTPEPTVTPDFRTPTAIATETKTEAPPPPATTVIRVETPTPVPAVVREQEVSPNIPNLENFPWTRDEILFSPSAGFQKLREGGIVTVYIHPDLSGQITEEAIAPWNNLGIELRGIPYLELTQDSARADIRFLSSPVTWVEPVNAAGKTDFENAYNTVTIHTATGENGSTRLTNIAASHEMGHAAFGFVDFLNPTEWAAYKNKTARGYIHPQNGSDPQKPYVGAMNYVYWNQHDVWFGKDDKSLLKLGGYT